MQNNDMVIRCLNCGAKNRIPRARLHDRPLCGKCRAVLDEMVIRCLNCGVKNRMPENRLSGKPICGRCRAPLVAMSEQGRPLDVIDSTFDQEILSIPGAVLVDCWAPWCGPCKMAAPILDELAEKYVGGVRIAKLNVDENPLTASRYGIRSIPALLFFKDGVLVDTLAGLLPKEQIEQHLIAIMKTN